MHGAKLNDILQYDALIEYNNFFYKDVIMLINSQKQYEGEKYPILRGRQAKGDFFKPG